MSVVDMGRDRLGTHPWSLGGGGAAELKEELERASIATLRDVVTSIGYSGQTNEDDAMFFDSSTATRLGLETFAVRPIVYGERVRDWESITDIYAFFPYRPKLLDLEDIPNVSRHLWPNRTILGSRATFAKKTYFLEGRPWWEWHQVALARLRTPLGITFADVAALNHFVLDRDGRLFNRTAPAIKLAPEAGEQEYLALVGPLNSSAGCFWMKQVFHNKGVGGIGGGIGDEPWEPRFVFDATKLARFPLPADPPTNLARTLDSLARLTSANTPAAICEREVPTAAALEQAHRIWLGTRRQMVAWQEELDWRCYRLYGITDEDLTYQGDLPEVAFGERAFEIVLARKVAAGELDTAWFTRHRADPTTEIPAHWPADYQALMQQRIDLIASSRDIGLIERPEYKRRWAHEPWETQQEKALRSWLLDRTEEPQFWNSDPAELQSVGRLSDRLRSDDDFLAVLALYLGRSDYDLTKAVADLVKDEAVPFLAALRYTDAGMTKRAEWEAVWDLQRREDQGEDVGTITPPPRYGRTDYRATSFWGHRGKLDVPKERFISHPGAEREADPSAVIGWAGWDHRQRAIALASHIQRAQDTEGWSAERLTPLLAGLLELIPWLLQWHNEPDAQGTRFGDFAQSFLRDRTARAGLSVEGLGAWRPPAPARGRRLERVEI